MEGFDQKLIELEPTCDKTGFWKSSVVGPSVRAVADMTIEKGPVKPGEPFDPIPKGLLELMVYAAV
ncbi:hypothetical protein [Bradyrhizobium sp. 5.13L]